MFKADLKSLSGIKIIKVFSLLLAIMVKESQMVYVDQTAQLGSAKTVCF
jgi:hypothetical protein